MLCLHFVSCPFNLVYSYLWCFNLWHERALGKVEDDEHDDDAAAHPHAGQLDDSREDLD